MLGPPFLLLLTSAHAFVNSSFLKLLARTLADTVIAPERVKYDSGVGLLRYLMNALITSLLGNMRRW